MHVTGCPASKGLWQHAVLHGCCMAGALTGGQGPMGARPGNGGAYSRARHGGAVLPFKKQQAAMGNELILQARILCTKGSSLSCHNVELMGLIFEGRLLDACLFMACRCAQRWACSQLSRQSSCERPASPHTTTTWTQAPSTTARSPAQGSMRWAYLPLGLHAEFRSSPLTSWHSFVESKRWAQKACRHGRFSHSRCRMSRTSHAVQDRLETLANVRDAGISVCAGGIIGMGEGNMDRVGLLHQLATLPEHPESVPINALVAVKGTPLQACLPQPTCIIAMSSSLWACGSFRGDILDAFGIRERILTARDASREKIRAANALWYFHCTGPATTFCNGNRTLHSHCADRHAP